MTIIKQISLAYKDSGSDKVYHTQIEEKNGGYNVNFQYGRRGATLLTGSKTASPVNLQKATEIYEKLIKEKTAKGYSEGQSGAIFQTKNIEERFTGIVPQLLNKITDPDKYIQDSNYFMQEKFDGHRRIIQIKSGDVTSINKKGLEVLSPKIVCDKIKNLGFDITVDGELVDDKYFIFDVLSYKNEDIRTKTAKERYQILKNTNLKDIAPAYFTKEEKQKFFDSMKPQKKKKEGVVYKHNDSEYISGRPNSGGNQLKFKFYATDTFEVVSHNTNKRSVNVVSYTEKGEPYDMGKITIPETTPIPDVGAFVEIRYLYCNEGGKLFQTTFLNVREDQNKTDCHMREIKFKAINDEDEEDIINEEITSTKNIKKCFKS